MSSLWNTAIHRCNYSCLQRSAGSLTALHQVQTGNPSTISSVCVQRTSFDCPVSKSACCLQTLTSCTVTTCICTFSLDDAAGINIKLDPERWCMTDSLRPGELTDSSRSGGHTQHLHHFHLFALHHTTECKSKQNKLFLNLPSHFRVWLY